MAQYVPKSFQGRVVMDFGDVDSAKFERYGHEGGGPMGWINRREGKLLADVEKRIARRADASLFVSEAEAALFRVRGDCVPFVAPTRCQQCGKQGDDEFCDDDCKERFERKKRDRVAAGGEATCVSMLFFFNSHSLLPS